MEGINKLVFESMTKPVNEGVATASGKAARLAGTIGIVGGGYHIGKKTISGMHNLMNAKNKTMAAIGK